MIINRVCALAIARHLIKLVTGDLSPDPVLEHCLIVNKVPVGRFIVRRMTNELDEL